MRRKTKDKLLTGHEQAIVDGGYPKATENIQTEVQVQWQGERGRIAMMRCPYRRPRLTSAQFTDMAKLLNTYQLWLDDLFPKAKFLDALGMVEKLGHKKKIQIYRKEWIDEGKPKGAMDDLDDFVANGGDRMDDLDDFVADGERPLPAFNFRTGSIHEYDRPVRENQGGNTIREGDPEDDELDALLQDPPPAQNQTRPDRPWLQRDAEEPDDDELDALLAEDPSTNNGNKSLFGGPVNGSSKPKEKAHDDFDDEEEAMAGMDW